MIAKEKTLKKNIEDLEKKIKQDRIIKIILVIIIIILLLLGWGLAWRMGKIGFSAEETTTLPTEEDTEIAIIKVTDSDVDWNKDTEVDIFSNEEFGGEKMIAPGSTGEYKFCIKNEVDNDITYTISFEDLMTNPVNMKYKLKIDNVYVRGNETTYVGIDELDLEDVIVLEGSNNVYTLEWCWIDSDTQDTYTGSQEETQYYTLNISIQSTINTED